MSDILVSARHLLGHFHPSLVHFPIAFLLGGAAIELWSTSRGFAAPSPLARPLIELGALAALPAMASGLALFHPQDFRGTTLAAAEVHRVLGLTTGALALVAAALGRGSGCGGRRLAAYRVACAITALVAGVAAHYGGWMVFGWGRIWVP